MTKSQTKPLPKLVLSSSRDIPFSQLVLSQKNVRRVKAGLSIEDLADDIYRRTLLQSLNVRAVIGDDGQETGMFEVPAGGRRFRALELLVKTKRMAKDQPVPCVVREAGIAEEDSLAENVMRVALHPLDQFRAFSALFEAGLSEDDIAARFFVSVSTVRQRLRLASVSPTLLDIYGEDGMTLEQLMAFSVTENHARQEQVWDQVNNGQHISSHHIRRLLTEDAIAATDRRVRFIGIDAYTEAGGYVMRDLFSTDGDGWLQDPALVELLVNEKLSEVAQEIGSEGWKCDWRIADLVDAKRPTTLYLVIPPSDISRTKPLIRLLLNQIGRRLTEELAPDAKRQRVLIMLDEFPALGRLDFFESALAFMAGYGLKAFLIAQSLNQIEHAYGQNNAILDNCHVRVCFATNDERTAKRVSESLGTATELRAMKNYAGHRLSPWLGHLMISKSETARSLLTPGEIQELPKTDEIVMMAGAHPIRAKKAQYFRDKRLSARVLSPPKVRAATKEASAPHDWQGMIAKTPSEAKRGPKPQGEHDSDPHNAGIRTEPELPIHEDIAPPPKPVAREFDFDRDEQNDDDAARNRRLQDRMRGNARRASLDPGDGIEL